MESLLHDFRYALRLLGARLASARPPLHSATTDSLLFVSGQKIALADT
jgi:hypothetical protein